MSWGQGGWQPPPSGYQTQQPPPQPPAGQNGYPPYNYQPPPGHGPPGVYPPSQPQPYPASSGHRPPPHGPPQTHQQRPPQHHYPPQPGYPRHAPQPVPGAYTQPHVPPGQPPPPAGAPTKPSAQQGATKTAIIGPLPPPNKARQAASGPPTQLPPPVPQAHQRPPVGPTPAAPSRAKPAVATPASNPWGQALPSQPTPQSTTQGATVTGAPAAQPPGIPQPTDNSAAMAQALQQTQEYAKSYEKNATSGVAAVVRAYSEQVRAEAKKQADQYRHTLITSANKQADDYEKTLMEHANAQVKQYEKTQLERFKNYGQQRPTVTAARMAQQKSQQRGAVLSGQPNVAQVASTPGPVMPAKGPIRPRGAPAPQRPPIQVAPANAQAKPTNIPQTTRAGVPARRAGPSAAVLRKLQAKQDQVPVTQHPVKVPVRRRDVQDLTVDNPQPVRQALPVSNPPPPAVHMRAGGHRRLNNAGAVVPGPPVPTPPPPTPASKPDREKATVDLTGDDSAIRKTVEAAKRRAREIAQKLQAGKGGDSIATRRERAKAVAAQLAAPRPVSTSRPGVIEKGPMKTVTEYHADITVNDIPDPVRRHLVGPQFRDEVWNMAHVRVEVQGRLYRAGDTVTNQKPQFLHLTSTSQPQLDVAVRNIIQRINPQPQPSQPPQSMPPPFGPMPHARLPNPQAPYRHPGYPPR